MGFIIWIFCLTSTFVAIRSHQILGLFSVPAPLFDLLAGSSAGFFHRLVASITPSTLPLTQRSVHDDDAANEDVLHFDGHPEEVDAVFENGQD